MRSTPIGREVRAVAVESFAVLADCPGVGLWGPKIRRAHLDDRLPQGLPTEGALVAEVAGRLAGFGTACPSRRHQAHAFLTIEVRPAMRRRGVGTVLLAALGDRMGRAFITRQFLSDAGTMAFFTAHGFGKGEVAVPAGSRALQLFG